MQGAEINASGDLGGGKVNIGGGFQGRDATIVNSQSTTIDAATTISARALISGDGGQVIVWSNGQTRHEGQIFAQGSPLGQGGFVEVSGKESLTYTGRTMTGGGTLLLDPYNYTIDSTAASHLVDDLVDNNVIVSTSQNDSTYGSTGSGSGDITVNSAVVWNSANSLTLLAQGNLNLNANVQNSGSGDVNVVAGWDGTSGLTVPGSFDLTPFTSVDVFRDGEAPFGNQSGSIYIGNSTMTNGVAVGSANGQTNVFAYDMTLRGSDSARAYAQLGFHHVGGGDEDSIITTGTINATLRNDLLMEGGNKKYSQGASSYVQIGHGGYRYESPVSGNPINYGYTGDIHVTAAGDVVLQGNAERAYAQIGHGGFWAHGNQSGQISVLAGSLSLLGGVTENAYAQIGHGAGAGTTNGNREGDIYVSVENATVLNGTRWRLGHNKTGVYTISNADVTLLTDTLVYDTEAAAASTQTLINSDFAAMMKANLNGGSVTVGSMNTNIGNTGGMLVDSSLLYTSGNNLNLLSMTDIRFQSSVQNSGGGNLNVIAGWDGSTGLIANGNDLLAFDVAPFLESTFYIDDVCQAFGHRCGSVYIGSSDSTSDVAVGTAFGQTSLFASDLTLHGGDDFVAAAQLGYRYVSGPALAETDIATGDIEVHLTDSLRVIAGGFGSSELNSSYAQIGHGGNRSVNQPGEDWNFSGDIIITARNNALLQGGNDGYASYAQIGHGGYFANGNASGSVFVITGGDFNILGGAGEFAYAMVGNRTTAGCNNGDLFLTADGDITLRAGCGNSAFAQFGHGGLNANSNARGDMQIGTYSNLTLEGDHFDAYAQIGHGDAMKNTSGTMSGDIAIYVNGETSLVNGVCAPWLIGHGTSTLCGINNANIVLLTNTLDYTSSNDCPATQTLLNQDFADKMVANLAGGDVTVGSMNELSGSSGGMLVEGQFAYQSSSALNLLSVTDIRIANNVQNSGTGNLNVIAGWDEITGLNSEYIYNVSFEACPLLTFDVLGNLEARPFGNLDGTVVIGSANQLTGVAVGSANGQTNVLADNLILRGSDTTNAYAQLGFHSVFSEDCQGATLTSGDINVLLTGNLLAVAGSQAECYQSGTSSYVQIGHGGNRNESLNSDSWNYAGDISVVARRDITFSGSDAENSYALLGNGGLSANGNHSGSHSVIAGDDIRFIAGRGTGSFAQLGNGGNGVIGELSGSHTVTAHDDIQFKGGSGLMSYAQFGNGGYGSEGAICGNLTMTAHRDIEFLAGSGLSSYAQFGHGGSGSTGDRHGNLTIVSADDLKLTSNRNGAYAQIGHSGYLELVPDLCEPITNTYSGGISVTISGNLTLDGKSGNSLPAIIGHGMPQGDSNIDNSVSGDITLSVGEGARLKHATIGHLVSGNGNYSSGNTWIAVATERSGSKLSADGHSQFLSASLENCGELRFYIPRQSTLSFDDSTLLNGTRACELYNELGFLHNRVGHNSPFEGDYDINSDYGNYGFYVKAIGLAVNANSGSSTYGDTDITNPEMSLAEGSELLLDGDTLNSIGLRTSFRISSRTDAGNYQLNVNDRHLDHDYELISSTSGTFTVNKADLLISPVAITKIDGVDYVFTGHEFVAVGLKNHDRIRTVELSSPGATSGASIGSYDITALGILSSRSFNPDNYNMTFETLENGFQVVTSMPPFEPQIQESMTQDLFGRESQYFNSIHKLFQPHQMGSIRVIGYGPSETNEGHDAVVGEIARRLRYSGL